MYIQTILIKRLFLHPNHYFSKLLWGLQYNDKTFCQPIFITIVDALRVHICSFCRCIKSFVRQIASFPICSQGCKVAAWECRKDISHAAYTTAGVNVIGSVSPGGDSC